jgi:hypothetical protein
MRQGHPSSTLTTLEWILTSSPHRLEQQTGSMRASGSYQDAMSQETRLAHLGPALTGTEVPCVLSTTCRSVVPAACPFPRTL